MDLVQDVKGCIIKEAAALSVSNSPPPQVGSLATGNKNAMVRFLPPMLQFDLDGPIARVIRIAMNDLNREDCRIWLQKETSHTAFGFYPRKIFTFDTIKCDTPLSELIARVEGRYRSVTWRADKSQIEKIQSLIPELQPKMDQLDVHTCKNVYILGDRQTSRAIKVELVGTGSVYDKAARQYRTVYYFRQIDTKFLDMHGLIKSSPSIDLNVKIVGLIYRYFWYIEKVHGKEEMHKSPLIKLSRWMIRYAQRTQNYVRVRRVVWFATNFIEILIFSLLVAGVIVFNVLDFLGDFERMRMDGDTKWTFFWNWQGRIDRHRIISLGLDPNKYYVFHWTERYGNLHIKKSKILPRGL